MFSVVEIYDYEVSAVFGPFSSRKEAEKFMKERSEKIIERFLSTDTFNSCPYSYKVRTLRAPKM